ncbi:LPS-assembly protein [Rubritalea squalenifaciens DSM 18772]|uniref:LPS-assembly protein n=1 Tax=Rubritalea squalenifaciens DSM 18772 TaxID=1123071 RepID=A0A1M6SJK8_9BACT|nr:LPS assembly protein LptD [Rubritalea squalenifaciens]SHK44768.1 LPS-assembly protein [Rubritalea squalenifaciens DSM 18772]
MKCIAASLAVLGLSTFTYAQDLPAENPEQGDLKKGGFGSLELMPKMPENIQILSSKGAEYNAETGMLRYDGNIQVNADNGMQLFANRAILDTKKEKLLLRGNVKIYQGTLLHRGDSAVYDYGKSKLETHGLRTSLDPILLEAGTFKSEEEDGKMVYVGRHAAVTTHDAQDPNYWIRADKVKVYPNERVEFNDMKLYFGDVPVFWLPYLSQPLDADLGYHFIPGARSRWGGFLLNRYGIMLGTDSDLLTGADGEPWLLSQWLVDFRSKRGLGTGVDLFDTRLDDNENLGWLKLYYANDLSPDTTSSGIPRDHVNEDRYRAEFKYRIESDSVADHQLIYDANLTWLSDRYYLEDFEMGQYNTNPEPDNILGVQLRNDRYQLGAFARIRINDFYQTDTRMPEIYFDQVKHPLFKSPILHEGKTSFGFYREDLADIRRKELRQSLSDPMSTPAEIAEANSLLERRDYARFNTWQEFALPLNPADGITLTPRAGAGYTRYWDAGADDVNFSRTNLYAGVDAAMKFTKRYSNARSERWGVNELLHVLQPYANLSVLSTDELDSSFPRIERLTPTVRPRPFGVGRFHALDDMNNWSILRLGVRNQLLTKRNQGSHLWLTMDSYVDYFINDPELNREFSNFYNDLYWSPLPWMSLGLETQFPISGEGFTEVSSVVAFMPHRDLEFRVRHRYLSSHPTLLDSNRLDLQAYYRINDDWGLDFYQQWEMDDSTLEEQIYSIHRNFDSWVASLGIMHRDNRRREEFGVLLSFSLRAFPGLNLPVSFSSE